MDMVWGMYSPHFVWGLGGGGGGGGEGREEGERGHGVSALAWSH